ncbi:MAG: hypothetical protein LBR92_02030 [Puniceicoccales bacterium]|jgi:hypothetical protein|nr:hypothetical protein [Puniceicoccales bacterium]
MEILGENMEKITETTDKDREPEKNISKISQKRKPRSTKDLTAAFDGNWELEEENLNTKHKKKIHQVDAAKKIIGDPWAIVPHTLLSSRKVAAGSKLKSKNIRIQKITTIKKLSKKNLDLFVETTPLPQRKAKQIDLLSQTLSQVIEKTLRDYNSINFRIRAS